MARLPERCAEILDRFFCRDESYRTIATHTGIAEGTIASRISRCLAKLKADIEGRNSPPRRVLTDMSFDDTSSNA